MNVVGGVQEPLFWREGREGLYRDSPKKADLFWKEHLCRAVETGTVYKQVSRGQYQQVRNMAGKPITHGTRYLLLMRGYHLRLRQEGRLVILEDVVHSVVEEEADEVQTRP